MKTYKALFFSIIIVIVQIIPVITFAENKPHLYLTAQELLSYCTQAAAVRDGSSDANLEDASFCQGYISAFLDGYMIGAARGSEEIKLCVPNGLVGPRILRLFITNMEEHTVEDLPSLSAAVAMTSTLRKSYPCPASNQD